MTQLSGCDEVPDEPIWQCGHGLNSNYDQKPICNGNRNIIYAWARDAEPLNLPPDTGFEIGQSTVNKFIVMQVHYKDQMKDEDYSGVGFEITEKEQKRKAGVFVLGHYGAIPPKATSKVNF